MLKLSKEKMSEIQDAFKDAGKNFTPAWVKKFRGYVNHTEFELPCKDIAGNEYASVEDFIKNEKFPYMGAEVKASNVKDGAVYPNSLIFLSEGKPYNPFAEFGQ